MRVANSVRRLQRICLQVALVQLVLLLAILARGKEVSCLGRLDYFLLQVRMIDELLNLVRFLGL